MESTHRESRMSRWTNGSVDLSKNQFSTRAKVALFIGILLIFICPIILTRNSWWFSFSETGQIGDTIGGITAPIIGLLGAYLVYLALMSQVKANQIIQQQINNQKEEDSVKQAIANLYEHYKILREEIVGFEHVNEFRQESEDIVASTNSAEFQVYRGTMGIFKYLVEFNKQFTFDERHDDSSLIELPHMAEIYQFLQFVIIYSHMIDAVKVPRNEKYIFTNLLSHLFYSKIAPSIEYFQSHSECCNR